MNPRLLLATGLIVTLALVAFVIEPGEYLNLAWVKSQQAELKHYVSANPWRASFACFTIYVSATALSIPGAFVMTLATGAVFGVLWGTVIVSFASTMGATIAFLMSRYLFRGLVQARLGHRLAAIDRGIAKDGPVYLLTLRLIPVVPFIGVNLLMALTPIRVRHFYLYSQIGMLPATLVYVNAGTQLADIQQAADIASPGVLVALAALSVLPLFAKAMAATLRKRKLNARFPAPRGVDRNVVVIGGGSAGLVASLIASAVRARVTLIEQNAMGGDCLNTGCVPSKSLLHVARVAQQIRQTAPLGITAQEPEIDFKQVMRYVQGVIQAIEPHDSRERYESLGVECITGRATVVTPYEVEVNGTRLTTRNIVIATGARPLVPQIPGLAEIPFVTSDTVWNLEQLPRRLVVLGGGPIGCELAQALSRLGSEVTIVEMAGRILPREDAAVSEMLAQALRAEGVRIKLGYRADHFESENQEHVLHCVGIQNNGTTAIRFDTALLALGRTANVAGYGLEALDLETDNSGRLVIDEFMRTSIPNIYACGDLAGPYQFTHMASHQAWYASINALFSGFKSVAVDYRVVPWCTFTEPEVARVGISAEEASEQKLAVELTEFPLTELDRAVADNATTGVVRILTAPGSDRILGATIVGTRASDMIAEFVMAMKHNIGLKKLLGTIHIYPTYAEANKLAAGVWRRRHAPEWALKGLQRFHRWRREGRSRRT